MLERARKMVKKGAWTEFDIHVGVDGIHSETKFSRMLMGNYLRE